MLVQHSKKIGLDRNKVDALVFRLGQAHNEREGEERERKILCYADIVRYLGKLKEFAQLSKPENVAVEELIEAIRRCRDDRNKVMHGEVENLFGLHERGKKWVWESYLLNLMNLMVVVHRHRSTFEKFVTNLDAHRKAR